MTINKNNYINITLSIYKRTNYIVWRVNGNLFDFSPS